MVEYTKQPLKDNSFIKENLIKILEILLGAGGLLSALLYFLGRLHIESYYYSLGISPSVLNFNLNDYMFSSFELVIMCVFVIILVFGYWFWATPQAILYLGFPFRDKKVELEKLNSIKEQKMFLKRIRVQETIIHLIYIIGFLFFLWLFLANFGTIPIIDSKGCMGFYAGYVIGISIIFIAWKAGIRRGGTTQALRMVLVILFLIVILPITTNSLAQKESQRDVDVVFPVVKIIYENELSSDLRDPSFGITNIIEGELVIANSGKFYILQSDNISITAIQSENIKEMTYIRTSRYYSIQWKR
jgi:hypothetical protein